MYRLFLFAPACMKIGINDFYRNVCVQEAVNNKVYISLCMRKLGLLIIAYKCTDEESAMDV